MSLASHPEFWLFLDKSALSLHSEANELSCHLVVHIEGHVPAYLCVAQLSHVTLCDHKGCKPSYNSSTMESALQEGLEACHVDNGEPYEVPCPIPRRLLEYAALASA